MKKLFKEFRDFINRGNVIDLAVGVMIGAACLVGCMYLTRRLK